MKITVDQAEEYLRTIGVLMPPNVDDRQWVLTMASAYAQGFINTLDWDTDQGGVALEILSDLWPTFEKWKQDEGIDPEDYYRS